ncbi:MULTISPECIES: hypothetical protein [unclassified Bartonella]
MPLSFQVIRAIVEERVWLVAREGKTIIEAAGGAIAPDYTLLLKQWWG